jgi:hypothetical protein
MYSLRLIASNVIERLNRFKELRRMGHNMPDSTKISSILHILLLKW